MPKRSISTLDPTAQADEELIMSLSKKLEKDEKSKKKTRREFDSDMGEGFNDFLDDLDELEDRLGGEYDDEEEDEGDNYGNSNGKRYEDDSDDDSDDEEAEEEDEPAMKEPSHYNPSAPSFDSAAGQDDLLIKRLSKRLSKGSGRSKLQKEWGDEMGEGFADFMDELDELGGRLGVEDDGLDEGSDGDSSDGDDSDGDSSDGDDSDGDDSTTLPPPVDSSDTYAPTPGEDIYGRPTPSSQPTSKPGAYVPPHLRKKLKAASSIEGSVDSGLKGTLNRLSEKNVTPVLRSVRSSTLPNSTILATFKSALTSLNKIAPDSNVRQNAGFTFIISCVSAGTSWSKVAVVLAEDAYKAVIAAGGREEEGPAGVNAAATLAGYFIMGHLSAAFVIGLCEHLVGGGGEGRTAGNKLVVLNFILDATGRKLARDMGEDERRVRDRVEETVRRMEVVEGKGTWMKDNALEKLKHLVKSKKKLDRHLESHGLITDADKTSRMVKEIREVCGDRREGKAIKAEDFRDVEKKGRWWKLGGIYNADGLDGSDAASPPPPSLAPDAITTSKPSGDEDDRISNLAAKMKMNTAFKKKVFRVLLTSFDHLEFGASITSMNLNHKDAREVVRVVIEVCGREKKFNSFYVEILKEMLEEDRKEHKMTINLSYKDSLKNLDTAKRARNLGVLASHLVGLQGLDFVYAFADVDFAGLTPEEIVFFVYLFGTALQELSSAEVESLASTVATKDGGMAADLRKFLKDSLGDWKANVKESMWREKYKRALKILKR
ncbi:hypothetical protein TrRE_jg11007 [Triparma retinervis]|uniref:MI domain-containing protein n=1 Tax=Triparma retinervis TaxID=2557542 RepID=A0A9W7G7P7_9STRA|nr:hypothetical protein TrRE_jg11007 [Triparma retinervis]